MDDSTATAIPYTAADVFDTPTPSAPAAPEASDASQDPITIPAALIKAIATWASTDTTRLPICHVRFEGRDVVATDGHRLILLRRGAGPSHAVPFHVPAKILLTAARSAGARGTVEIAPSEAVRAITAAKRGETPLITEVAAARPKTSKVAWQFPAWQHVVPSLDGELVVAAHACNPGYLAAMADVVAALGMRGTPYVSLRRCDDAMSPIVYTASGSEGDATLVIMPCRS